MKEKLLSNIEISQFCQELAVLLHAGIMLGDGLSLLAQEESGRTSELLAEIGRQIDMGAPPFRRPAGKQCLPLLRVRHGGSG